MTLRWRRQHEHEHAVRKMYEEQGGPLDALPRVFYGYDSANRECLHALVSRERWSEGDERWHVSISADGRVPTWDEIASALHELRPGIPFVLGVPPRSMWLNLHEHVLHAWETKDAGLLEEWRVNARGDVPS